MSETIDLAIIRLDGGTQPRSAIIEEVVRQYAEDLARGDAFPPVVLFFDGNDYWLADGFHRYHGAKANGLCAIECDVHQGTQRDAILYSVGCNADHGLRRTNEDKRRAVLRLLNDPEWAIWSDREIARACRVTHPFVSSLRPQPAVTGNVSSDLTPKQKAKIDRVIFLLSEEMITRADANARIAKIDPQWAERAAARTYTTKHGTVATMNTGAIGRLPPVTQPSAAPEREQAFAAARADMDRNGPIFDAIDAIKREFGKLPDAEEAARRFPRALRHTFSPAQAEHIALWFSEFGRAWVIENGESNVIAAE